MVGMQRDVNNLHRFLVKSEKALEKKTLDSRLRLVACQILDRKQVTKYQGRIDTHCVLLINIHCIVSGYVMTSLCKWRWADAATLR